MSIKGVLLGLNGAGKTTFIAERAGVDIETIMHTNFSSSRNGYPI